MTTLNEIEVRCLRVPRAASSRWAGSAIHMTALAVAVAYEQ